MIEAVEKLCPVFGYLIDIYNGWNLNLKIQTLEDWRLIKKIKSFFANKAPMNEVTFNSYTQVLTFHNENNFIKI